MRYVASRLEQEFRDVAYRIYISESFRAITHIDIGYSDMIDNTAKNDEKSGDEIAADIIEKLGLKIG